MRRRISTKPYDAWLDLEWEEDAWARYLVASHRGSMTLDEIGAELGLTRERVRQVEAAALKVLNGAVSTTVMLVESFGDIMASPECSECSAPFVRLTGRQLYCQECSDAKRTTMRSRNRIHVLEPSTSDDARRRALIDKRLRRAKAAIAARAVAAPADDAKQEDLMNDYKPGGQSLLGEPGGACGIPRAGGTPCPKIVTKEHEGRWYCGIHYPPGIQVRSQRRLETMRRKGGGGAEPRERPAPPPDVRAPEREEERRIRSHLEKREESALAIRDTAPASVVCSQAYTFPLRKGWAVALSLPEDLTQMEAERLADFIKMLPTG